MIDRGGAGYIERCPAGSVGGSAETASESWYGAVGPTLSIKSLHICLLQFRVNIGLCNVMVHI